MEAPAKLYRYRALLDDAMLERELDTLRNSYLFAPPFGAMNDPMEAFYETGSAGDSIVDALLMPSGKGTSDLYKMLDDTVTNFALVSFSSAPDDLPLWAYYAGNFAGICLEFDTENLGVGDFQNESLKPVEYAQKPLPPIGLSDLGPDRMEKSVLARITRKRTEWAHEKEWRYVTGSVGPKHYLDDCLTRIFLGPRIKPKHANAIHSVLDKRPVEILQGEVFGYDLRFRSIKQATPQAECERIGGGTFVRDQVLYARKELEDFLSVPIDPVIAECERIAARPNFVEFIGLGVSANEPDRVYLNAACKLRSGRNVYDSRYYDRHFHFQPRSR